VSFSTAVRTSRKGCTVALLQRICCFLFIRYGVKMVIGGAGAAGRFDWVGFWRPPGAVIAEQDPKQARRGGRAARLLKETTVSAAHSLTKHPRAKPQPAMHHDCRFDSVQLTIPLRHF
jgi:hypothetical protein